MVLQPSVAILLSLALVTLTQVSEKQKKAAESRDLYRLEFVTKLDTQVDEGSFDTGSSIDRKLVKSVRNCVDAVRAFALEWADSEKLATARDDRMADQLTLHFESAREVGVFEILYRLNLKSGWAQGRFRFYDGTGAVQAHRVVAFADFKSRLSKAMTCGS